MWSRFQCSSLILAGAGLYISYLHAAIMIWTGIHMFFDWPIECDYNESFAHKRLSLWWSFLCFWETLLGNLNSRTGVSVLNWNKRHIGLVSHLVFDKAVLDMPLGIEEPARAWQLTVLVAVTHLLSFTVGMKDSEYKKWTICTRICLLLD